ncbi:unnamed protein product [Moneuplotes crassus]|uniref:Uncharacterized protein n=1 Tax=Euplotes crassus TaxID=5936 RepID=A0AAD1XSL9_EUPCR|nr:unnamed protein product [Moneuplotes crassus]
MTASSFNFSAKRVQKNQCEKGDQFDCKAYCKSEILLESPLRIFFVADLIRYILIKTSSKNILRISYIKELGCELSQIVNQMIDMKNEGNQKKPLLFKGLTKTSLCGIFKVQRSSPLKN